MNRYRKTYVAFTAAVITTIGLLWGWDVTQEDAVALASTWLGVGGVFLFPNTDEPVAEGQRGAGEILLVLVTVLATLALLIILGVDVTPDR